MFEIASLRQRSGIMLNLDVGRGTKSKQFLGLNLLCATNYFGYGKGTKLPHKSRFPPGAVCSRYLQSLLPSALTFSGMPALFYRSSLATVNYRGLNC